MTGRDVLRYAVWGLVAFTANANRRHYRMTTTWLPHLTANSISLLLPDALRLLLRRPHPRNPVEAIVMRMARDNPHYVLYVTPLAAGYILSHPRFNIYKGEWAELRWMGFGLDSIPHTATAMAFTALVHDSLRVVSNVDTSPGLLGRLIDWAAKRSGLVSFILLALVTLVWEYGEYRVHKRELALRGDITLINMQWSVEDTRKDVISNLIGWVLGLLLHRVERRLKLATVPE
ncbi:MAG: hypothetical protein DIU68_017775 [Chloroflexota bacterium]|nr:MAG: hypothetical protein DIU68_19670 [Chloroflexota bacterium]